MSKFRVGDRVIVTSQSFYAPKGSLGSVVVCSDVDLGVQFDNNVKGHDCHGCGKWGHCWYVPRYLIELYLEEEDDLYV